MCDESNNSRIGDEKIMEVNTQTIETEISGIPEGDEEE